MLIGSLNKPRVSVGFIGFHSSFNPLWNNITHSIAHRHLLDVSLPGTTGHLSPIPDYLFFSVYEHRHLDPRYRSCVKIFTCEENIRPPWKECQYALTGDYSVNPHHLRLPIYVRVLIHLPDQQYLRVMRRPSTSLLKTPTTDWHQIKPKFCNFVFSNHSAHERIHFFEMLSKYKKVDSGGSVLNNLGYKVKDKVPFLEDYKFTIAFENSSYPGYVSEKIVEPMIAGSVPIYWGSPCIEDDFNPASLVVATGRRLEDVVDEIVALDRDDDKYLAMLAQPWFHDNQPNHYCKPGYLADFLEPIFGEKR